MGVGILEKKLNLLYKESKDISFGLKVYGDKLVTKLDEIRDFIMGKNYSSNSGELFVLKDGGIIKAYNVRECIKGDGCCWSVIINKVDDQENNEDLVVLNSGDICWNLNAIRDKFYKGKDLGKYKKIIRYEYSIDFIIVEMVGYTENGFDVMYSFVIDDKYVLYSNGKIGIRIGEEYFFNGDERIEGVSVYKEVGNDCLNFESLRDLVVGSGLVIKEKKVLNFEDIKDEFGLELCTIEDFDRMLKGD